MRGFEEAEPKRVLWTMKLGGSPVNKGVLSINAWNALHGAK
jgi:hypothetical protein